MKIHEYQAKELFKKFDIPIPDGEVAFSPDEAKAAAEKLGQFPFHLTKQRLLPKNLGNFRLW